VAVLLAGRHADGGERLMAPFSQRAGRIVRSPVVGYAAAIAGPVVITLGLVGFRLPAFVLEHLSLLLVVAVAVRWGIGPAIVAAIVSVFADNVLLREPFGQSPVTGIHDFTDLGLFAIVAVTIGWLVATVRRERARAELAVQLERQAREDRDRFVATLSHDLATPLTAISGTVQFAQRFGGAAAVDMPRLLARLGTAAARATSLLRSLQDARARENGGLEMRCAPLDLREALAPIVEMLDRMSDRHPIALTMPDEPIPIEGDAERLQRVIENVISNAIKYSPHGGRIDVSARRERGSAVLRVRDHGIGVSPEALPRIFQPSFRAAEAEDTASGLGLGLSIAAEIVRLHGGVITAVNADPGLIVSLRLPLAGHGQGHGRTPTYTDRELEPGCGLSRPAVSSRGG
jgi:signal transduction histidine kinase